MHPFSLNKQEQAQVTGGAFPGGCIITPFTGEGGDDVVIFR